MHLETSERRQCNIFSPILAQNKFQYTPSANAVFLNAVPDGLLLSS